MNLPSSRPGPRFVALALCGLLTVTACSDNQGAGGGDDGESELAANARAAAINVSLADLPEGYAAIPPSEEGDEPAPVEGCIDGINDVSVAAASSPIFRLQTDASLHIVGSKTSILSDPEPAERLLASVQEQSVLACLSERLSEIFLPNAAAETPLVLAPDLEFPDVGEQSLRLTGTGTFATESASEPLALATSLVFIQTDDAVSVLVFGGIIEPFPSETAQAVAAAVADRQAD